MNKYKAIKTDGYASKREAKRAAELKLLLKAGGIYGLLEQVTFQLAPSVVVQGRKRPPLRYIADFTYYDKPGGTMIVEDCKGFRTPEYRIKRHLMMSVHGIELLET